MSKRVRSVTNLVPIEGFGVVAEWSRRSQRHGGNLEEVKDEQEAIQKEGEKERIEKFKLTVFFFFFFFFSLFLLLSFFFHLSLFLFFFKRSLPIHLTVIPKMEAPPVTETPKRKREGEVEGCSFFHFNG